MKVLQSSDILSSEIDRAQCQLQPLLLDRSCFVRKLDQLDASQIDKLDWNNLNRDFCDYWSYFASDDKKRQHMLRQIVDQKTNIDRSEKEEKCAAYLLRYISQSKQQPKGERLVSDLPVEKAESTISDEFVKCFRDGQSKANATVKRRRCERTEPAPAPAPYTNYQSEKRAILKQLKMCRNPYEVELLKQKLRRLKELEQRMSEAPERLLKHGKRTSDEAPAGRAPKPLKDKFLPYNTLTEDQLQRKIQLQSQSSFSIQSISSGIDQSKRSKKPPIEREVQLENVEEEESRNDSEIWDILKQHPPLPMQPYMPEMLRKLKTLDLRIYYRQMMRSSNSAASEQQESSNLSICGNW
ncbi:hypothetical protein AWZ03_003396 [Drosophila navojoa]|uniref:Uncharacterized protein n=1 Tax=Drosophila navojoa TaxID=7232 RepID=A0A484BQ49_DRONA|nr:hypothetical protein AWZ03_003396 [Drosophila navojoa]